eukprot:10230317-Lingulodinium_polyedra.AAC.1
MSNVVSAGACAVGPRPRQQAAVICSRCWRVFDGVVVFVASPRCNLSPIMSGLASIRTSLWIGK